MIEDQILFATTASFDLFEVSGPEFVSSFGQQHAKSGHKLWMGLEGIEIGATQHFIIHDLDTDDMLATFLRQNADVIPEYLGGNMKPCDCPDTKDADGKEIRHARHRSIDKRESPGPNYKWAASKCHYQWMNRNASRWFRKVVTLYRAASAGQHRYLVWCDIDCRFLAPMSVRNLTSKFLRGKAIAYFKGPKREAPEVGVVCFDLQDGGLEFISRYMHRYTSRRYLAWHRWDDGFIFGTLIADHYQDISIDLVTDGRSTNVIPLTPMREFVHHRKGFHGRQLGIMK